MRLLGAICAGGIAALAAACDPSDFDDAVKDAPIKTIGRPSSFGATDFGRVVLPLRPDSTRPEVAGRFLAAGSNGRGISVVEFDKAGLVTVRLVSPGILGDLEGKPVGSAAELQDPAPGGKVIIGVPRFGDMTGRYFILSLAGDFSLTKGPEPADLGLTAFGLGVAAGKVSGEDAEDYAVMADEKLTLVEDGTKQITNGPECDLRLEAGLEDRYRLRRSVVVGDIVPGKADEIVVGLPRATGIGNVRVVRKGDAMVPALACVLTLSAPDGVYDGKRRFGQQLALGDFNADGQADLLVGAPPDRAFVYFGPMPDMQGPVLPSVTLMPMDSTRAKEFGGAVAAANVDGKPGDEALVGDPEMTLGDKIAAGQAFVYGFTGAAAALTATLADNPPEINAFFGVTVNAMRFCPGTCPAPAPSPVLVGAVSEVHAYFRIKDVLPNDLRSR